MTLSDNSKVPLFSGLSKGASPLTHPAHKDLSFLYDEEIRGTNTFVELSRLH